MDTMENALDRLLDTLGAVERQAVIGALSRMLDASYNEGYDEGQIEGYSRGFEDGRD